jgi:hypothetical protein
MHMAVDAERALLLVNVATWIIAPDLSIATN